MSFSDLITPKRDRCGTATAEKIIVMNDQRAQYYMSGERIEGG